MGADNVDRRLLPRFEASEAEERARRELLPPQWVSAEPVDVAPGDDDEAPEPFERLLRRARERVRQQRKALDRRSDETDAGAPPPQSQA